MAFSTAGPVFINPNAVVVPFVSSSSQENYVTQTVYGFLDFTTTIGNTVMVFSPQSAAVSGFFYHELILEILINIFLFVLDIQNDVKDIAPSTVIETKPITQSTVKKDIIIIKPSKTQIKVENNFSSFTSLVQVQSSPPLIVSSKVEIKALSSSKVNVIEGKPNMASKSVSSKVEVVSVIPSKAITPQHIVTKKEVISKPPIIASKVELITRSKERDLIINSVMHPKPDEGPVAIIGNNIGEPEYDFLSRQPSEVVEETYKVINLKPSSKFHLKPRPIAETKNKAATKRGDSLHPTGLVTKLGGTVVKDGTTTIHETSVIGTYISGKYAQVLQSTSHIHNNHQKAKISPSPTLRILKTAAPLLGKGNKHHRHLEPTPAGSINEETALPVDGLFNSHNAIKSTRKPTGPGSLSLKARFKNRPKDPEVTEENNEQDVVSHSTFKKSQRTRLQTQPVKNAK